MNETEISNIPIKLEEEEVGRPKLEPFGFNQISEEAEEDENTKESKRRFTQAYSDFLRSLGEERKSILDNEKLTAKEKKILLDENRKMLVIANGGTIKRTDSVVYGILIFGGVVLITLSLLNVFKNLDTEITVAFVGTVLGGTIATIAQKLGKL